MTNPSVIRRRAFLFSLAVFFVAIDFDESAAQDSSLLRKHIVLSDRPPITLENVSLIYEKPEPPKTLQLHDTITVIVKINTRVLSEGDAQNRKTSSLNAVLASWVHFDGLSLKPDLQNDGDQRVQGQLTSQLRAEADLESRDSLIFNIAAQVVDIRPNGNLVIEAHRTIQNNSEVWQQSLYGIVSRKDIDPNNTVISDKIAELRIDKREVGQVRDGYKRGWFQKFYDTYLIPF